MHVLSAASLRPWSKPLFASLASITVLLDLPYRFEILWNQNIIIIYKIIIFSRPSRDDHLHSRLSSRAIQSTEKGDIPETTRRFHCCSFWREQFKTRGSLRVKNSCNTHCFPRLKILIIIIITYIINTMKCLMHNLRSFNKNCITASNQPQ